MISGKMNLFKYIFILIFIYIISLNIANASSLLINEVMFNPIEDDRYFEWIECYNPTNKSINMSNWNVSDNYATDLLEPDPVYGNGSMILPAYGYCLITDQGSCAHENQSIAEDTLFLTVDDAAIGNGLGNSGDCLILTDSNNSEIDAIEWGEDFDEITGNPLTEFDEGYSIIRKTTHDSNDTSIDFVSTRTTTPGQINMISSPGSISIRYVPQYIAKPFSNQQYSIPISFYVELSNYTAFETYEVKASIQDILLSNEIASQTWDGEKWQYSDRYVITATTDNHGSWGEWIHVRFNKDYVGFSNVIHGNDSGCIQIKVRHDQQIDEHSQEIRFLDMDNSTSNALNGGYMTHILTGEKVLDTYEIFMLKNNDNQICGINSIHNNPDLMVDKKYIKIAAPADSNYSLFAFDNNQYMFIKDNITIKQGIYDVSIIGEASYSLQAKTSITIMFSLCNTGQLDDTYLIKKLTIPTNWNIIVDESTGTINAGKNRLMKTTISPSNIIDYSSPEKEIKLLVTSSTDPESYAVYHFYCEVKGPDLSIPKIKTYDENGNEQHQVKQGQIIRIKAYYKNYGNENASDSSVSFYLDEINESKLLCKKPYESIGKHQKYPSYYLDTSHITPGNHIIYVIADKENKIAELNDLNNQNKCTIFVENTTPSYLEQQIIISEIYFDNHPGIPNEYLCLYNPTNTSINISSWYITTKPDLKTEEQNKIIFLENTEISSNEHIYITQNASAFYQETGFYPTFEYEDDSLECISQLTNIKTVIFSNQGSSITLKNPYNHTIDQVVYGNINCLNSSIWTGPSITQGKTGQIYKRTYENDTYLDTDCCKDWENIRYYFIGQSQFSPTVFKGIFNLTLFVSPDNSYQAIRSELENASESILINMYEFTNNHLCNKLITLLRRNISVTLLLEQSPVGGIDEKEWIILHRLNSAGATIYFIIQNTTAHIYNRYPFNHAKYVIIDNSTTIIESCNFATLGIPINPHYGNREWGVVIRNQRIAHYFHTLFKTDCNRSRLDIASFENVSTYVPNQFYIDTSYFSGEKNDGFPKKTLNVNATITPILSPDTSLELLLDLITHAKKSIYIQQLYIYSNWTDRTSPLVSQLIKKANQGLDIQIIMNYNPTYEATIIKCNYTKNLLKEHGIKVKFIYTNESTFSNMHNKGLIIDNQTVLISSINWNENSIMRNRETGVIIQSKEVAQYYLDFFIYDWNLDQQYDSLESDNTKNIEDSDHTIYIIGLFAGTFIIIAHDWRKRNW